MTGRVALVGAGPGNPGLLTIRAKECLEQATVVVHDRLIPQEVLELAPPGTRRIYVGKGPREHAVPQDGINELLVDLALAGERVVRLKGGDPFVFGRGGEEALTLRGRAIPFEIVPGVSSSIAAPAFAGIPVTHRGLAASFTVLTGHEDPSKPESSHHWEAIAHGSDTLIILMGVEQMADIVARLQSAGRPADQPAAIVQWGTTPRQVTVRGTLGSIVEQARQRAVKPPSILVVGEVAALHDELAWWDQLPLFGLRVLVTRSRQQASSLVRRLRELGAAPVEIPAIDIQPSEDVVRLDDTLHRLDTFDWIVFTSPNGVSMTMERLLQQGKDARALSSARICVIGPATRQALRHYALHADAMPDRYTSEDIVPALELEGELSRRRIVLFRSDIAPDAIVTELQGKGAIVESVTSYRTVPAESHAVELRRRLVAGELDVLTFTSSSTVQNFMDAAGSELRNLARDIPAICIGPVTAEAARRQGLRVERTAEEFTIDGLIQALTLWHSSRKDQP